MRAGPAARQPPGRDPKDDAVSAVVGQILVLSVTTTVVLGVAALGFASMDEAMDVSEHRAGLLALEDTMLGIDRLTGQGPGASNVFPLPDRGSNHFTPFESGEDRLVVIFRPGLVQPAPPTPVRVGGLGDGDDIITVQTSWDPANLQASECDVVVRWHAGDVAGRQQSKDCMALSSEPFRLQFDHDLRGLVEVRVNAVLGEIGPTTVLKAWVTDFATLEHQIRPNNGVPLSGFLTGNMVISPEDVLHREAQVSYTSRLNIDVLQLTGPAFASNTPGSSLYASVTAQTWLEANERAIDVTVQGAGPRGPGIHDAYVRAGGFEAPEEDRLSLEPGVVFLNTWLSLHRSVLEVDHGL